MESINFRLVILILAITNLFLGGLFLIGGNFLSKANKSLKKWISTERFEKALNSMRDIDSHVLKVRHFIGTLCLIAGLALVFLYIN